MIKMIFDLQRFAKVLVGKTTNDKLAVAEDKTQIYGLAGNDTLENDGKSEVLLIGGSGNDVLSMTGGNGTLSGGNGSDTFNLSYSADKKISAVIEDIDPTKDKIVITHDGSDVAKINTVTSGGDVILTDESGYFNLTLKGSNDASDYYEGTANEYVWEILRLVNQEREDKDLPPLTMSQALSDGTSIRAKEIEKVFSHTRPNGTSYATTIKKSYNSWGENIAAGQTSPENVMNAWMNSTGHRANILRETFKKIGVGYYYDKNSEYKHHWVQLFGGDLSSPDTISTSEILETEIILNDAKNSIDTTTVVVTDTTKSPVTVGSAVEIINASTRTTAVKIIGNKLANTISGGTNNDTIQGGSGNDSIVGNAGNDSLIGNAGNDNIYGNAGNDKLYGSSGNDSLWGGAGNDTLIGNDGNDKLYGNAGADSMLGGAGNDTLSGGDGNDKLYGNAGNDKLYGGSGKDSLWGGAGNDTLYGGKGTDIFTFLANNGTDYINDYESGELLRFYNSSGKSRVSFSKSVFSDDTLTLTIKGGGTVVLNDVDSSDKFNINGTSYKVSGSKLAKA